MSQILLVEDNLGDVRLITEFLYEARNHFFSLQHVDRIQEAIDHLSSSEIDIVLLDLSLPDGSGLDSVRMIRSTAPQLPIVVLTGTDDDQVAIEALQVGAQDYLIKGEVTSSLLWRCMRYAIERKKLEERLQYLALHDSLTGLPNRALFRDRLSQAIERSKRWSRNNKGKWEFAVMLIDLDDFKSINDTYGHPEGDVLLKRISARLTSTVRQCDTVARLGGDEFIILCENVLGKDDVTIIAKKILDIFSQPFELEQCLTSSSASIGISLYPRDGNDFKSLLQTADIAMYQAKKKKNCFSFYGEEEESS